MKKNLAKRIVLGLLTGAVLMSSSVAWAEGDVGYNLDVAKLGNAYFAPNSLSIGGSVFKPANDTGCEKSIAIGIESQVGSQDVSNQKANDSVAVGYKAYVTRAGSIALGSEAQVDGINSMALGYQAKVTGGYQNSVALGKGSVASESYVVSVGVADDPATTTTDEGVYRKIVNVEDGTSAHDAATVGQVEAITGQVNFGSYTLNYIQNNDNLTTAVVNLDKQVKANASAIESLGNNLVTKDQNGSVTINVAGTKTNPIVMDNDGITVGTNSARMDGTGFYVWDGQPHDVSTVKASMTKDGEIKGINGTFSGNVTAANLYNKTEIDDALELKANAADVYKKTETYSQGEVDTKLADKADKATTLAGYGIDDAYTKKEVDGLIGGGTAAIAGLNQRLEKTNAKINKVGAGAAALAALHPLDYDPDDKLTFSAGMGNYAGENAAALGAFYRPNEKFMVSLGGTMGNGENMVNLGLSIGLDKASGFAKMSKRELIQEVNAVKAENEAMKDQLANADERIAKLEALVAQLVAK